MNKTKIFVFFLIFSIVSSINLEKYFNVCSTSFLKVFCKRNSVEKQYSENMSMENSSQIINEGAWTPILNGDLPDNVFFTTQEPQNLKLYLVRNFNKVEIKEKQEILVKQNLEVFTKTDLEIVNPKDADIFGNYFTFRIQGEDEVNLKFISHINCFDLSIGAVTKHILGIKKCSQETFESTVYVNRKLLNSVESRGFWTYWNSTCLVFGLEGDLKPKIQLKVPAIGQIYKVQFDSRHKTTWNIPSFKYFD